MKSAQLNHNALDLWDIGRADLGAFERAGKTEWLVTNGRGGCAAGTIADANTISAAITVCSSQH